MTALYLGNKLCIRMPLANILPERRKKLRQNVILACEECKRRNYTTKKNKRNDPDRIEMKKYCKWCGSHTLHKETR